MTILDHYFPLGLGTSRFPIKGPDDTEGIEKAEKLILKAFDSGIDYIDTSYQYSAGMAHTALKSAFKRTKKPFGVTVKVMLEMDKTADEARRRAEFQLEAMGISKASFFVCWTILNFTDFQEIMKKGGIYDGALKLKDEGLVKHICCSLHSSPEDSIKIIESGAFEGATISHSLLSSIQTLPVLNAALKHNIGIAVMNPLGGGIIPQNADFFAFASSENEDTVTAALRYTLAHPAVKIVLSGVSNESELEANVRAVSERSSETDEERLSRVSVGIRSIPGFCVNCQYCDTCPAGIPISELMRGRNRLLFSTSETYNRDDPELTGNIRLFKRHFNSHSVSETDEWFPDSPVNPCIRCGKCEEKCTQKLNIMDSISDIYCRAEKAGFSRNSRRERLEELLTGKGFTRVGLYPNGGFANLIMSLYDRSFGNPDFEWLQFNSDPKMWGQFTGGLPIHAPDKIDELMPDIIIVCTYKYDKEIFESLKHYEDIGIKIVKLHRETDVPWVF